MYWSAKYGSVKRTGDSRRPIDLKPEASAEKEAMKEEKDIEEESKRKKLKRKSLMEAKGVWKEVRVQGRKKDGKREWIYKWQRKREVKNAEQQFCMSLYRIRKTTGQIPAAYKVAKEAIRKQYTLDGHELTITISRDGPT